MRSLSHSIISGRVSHKLTTVSHKYSGCRTHVRGFFTPAPTPPLPHTDGSLAPNNKDIKFLMAESHSQIRNRSRCANRPIDRVRITRSLLPSLRYCHFRCKSPLKNYHPRDTKQSRLPACRPAETSTGAGIIGRKLRSIYTSY